MNENFELENMRQQMNTLKKKLEQQEIVNDRVIRHSMKKTAGNISRRYYFIMVLCLLMIPYSYWAFVKLNGFSIPFWIFTCVVMLVSFGGTFYNSRKLSDSNMMTNNLVDVRRRMASGKKFDANWLFLGIPLAIVFLGWFMYESYLIHGEAFSNGLFWLDASVVPLEQSGDSHSTSKPSASIRRLSTRSRTSLLNNKYGCHIHQRPLTAPLRSPAVFFVVWR